jgi:hypothetical protein
MNPVKVFDIVGVESPNVLDLFEAVNVKVAGSTWKTISTSEAGL